MRSFLIVMVLGFITSCSVFGGKAANEPSYELIKKEGDFEIREYGSYVIAEVFYKGNFEDASENNFSKLFDYISGKNTIKANIEMTAPVIMENTSQKIEMTTPILQERSLSGWNMAFVLPESFTIENAPKPIEPAVSLKEVRPRKIAVARYSGFLSEEKSIEVALKLREWLDKNGYDYNNKYQLAGYNPPWTIPALRRNEVHIELNN